LQSGEQLVNEKVVKGLLVYTVLYVYTSVYWKLVYRTVPVVFTMYDRRSKTSPLDQEFANKAAGQQ